MYFMKFLLRFSIVIIYILFSLSLIAQTTTVGHGENIEQISKLNQEGLTVTLKVNSVNLVKVKHKSSNYYEAIIPSFAKVYPLATLNYQPINA